MQALIDSITAQTYGNFELCLADGSTDGKTAAFVERRYGSDPRIRLKRLEVNGGISENTNAAIRMATGEFPGCSLTMMISWSPMPSMRW